mmetsp:Transcript_56598/g.184061  ORF Transcript_56598/g.184061 Transcript_56598/m.184061 type:complete len:266 (-) Transcript_56598:1316-2113(-)
MCCIPSYAFHTHASVLLLPSPPPFDASAAAASAPSGVPALDFRFFFFFGCSSSASLSPGALRSTLTRKLWPQSSNFPRPAGGAEMPHTRAQGGTVFGGIVTMDGTSWASVSASTSNMISLCVDSATMSRLRPPSKHNAVGKALTFSLSSQPRGTLAWCCNLSKLKMWTTPFKSEEANHSPSVASRATGALCFFSSATTLSAPTSNTTTSLVVRGALANNPLPQKSSARAGMLRISEGRPSTRRTSKSSRFAWKSLVPASSLAAKC